ncbi:MAG: TauD/TfdA family dioxygenase [Alphaproteobacteria bacterium]|nr:TauD/TfdA family dioxygenase [Alphaproteobacteria bacterium]
MEHARITTRAAWKGSEVDYRSEMMHRFSAGEVAEIDAALRHCGERDIPEITPETFPLPGMGATMRRLRDELLDGTGVVLLRGFPRERYTADEMARVYVGLGAHLGEPIAQSWQGQLLGSVIDISDVVEKVRGYNAGGGQHFHIDGSACDIVSLMCLRAAKSGGASRIVSVAAVHNQLLDTRPDLLDVLYRGYYHRNHEMDAKYSLFPPQSAEKIPVFTQTDGRITCVIDTGCLRYAVHYGGVKLTDEEIAAYDELQRISRSEEFFLDMNFEEGDIQFLNNRSIMHGRTNFEDHDEVARRRHLLRLWLRVPDWPDRLQHQIFMNEADCRHWAGRRTPFMDMPSQYLASLMRQQEERKRADTVMPKQAPSQRYRSAADWKPETELVTS